MAEIKHIIIFAFVVSAFSVQGDYCFGPRMRGCRDGHCIATDFFCNGENDCGDWSDEFNCEKPVESGKEVCPLNSFNCQQKDFQCIPWSWICDGVQDCVSGRDEANCSNLNECYAGFKCGRECILKSWVCDGTTDCMDSSDEKDCAVIEDENLMETIVIPTGELNAHKGGANQKNANIPQSGVGFNRQVDELVPYLIQSIRVAVDQILEAVGNPCTSNPCNNGVCSAQNSTNYICYCPQGFRVASVDPFKCDWSFTQNEIRV